MKAILQSIKPQYCELIAAGKKTIEVRKSKSKLKTPFKCYIYMTKSEDGCYSDWEYPRKQKVIGEYVCDEISEFTVDEYSDHLYYISDDELVETWLLKEELWDYGKGKTLYGWHISDLVIYDEPKELNDFAKANFPTFDEMEGSLCEYCPVTNFGQDFVNGVPDDFQCDVDCYDAYEEYAAQNRFLTRPPQSWCYVEED